MTTYAETQTTPTDWVEALETPTHYSLFLAPAPSAGLGYIEVAPDSRRPDAFEVAGIPASVRPDRVATHLASIAIWEHPDVLDWAAVADLRAGTLLRVMRDVQTEGAEQVGALVPDPRHWTGFRSVGSFRAAI